MKIVVLDGYTINPGDLSWKSLEKLGECNIYERTAPEELAGRAEDADALLTNKVCITAEAMDKLPKLKYIGVLATGYNVVDIEAARERGIVVTNIPAYSTPSVGQMVFAHILNITQRVGHYADEVSDGKWSENPDFCYWNTPLIELLGKKIGLIGLGQTGYNAARIGLGFGMKIWAYPSKSKLQLPPEIKKVNLDSIFRECDIISLHCPLNDETAEIVNASRLSLMKPTSILINTGRGGLINEQDLADALNQKKLYAAGLDVLSTEPPRIDNPLLKARNCFITPHIAWATTAARERLLLIMCENLEAFINGKPINNVAG